MSAEPQLFRINPENRESEKITEVDFARLGLQERRDIQEWIAANPGILGEGLLVICKEFSGFDRTNERLDLLAVDQDGRLVIIELKRDHSGADTHWQAIKYASYVHRARREDIVRMFAEYEGVPETEAEGRLLQHLGADDLNGLNNGQRIILASHKFAPEVTSAVLWLNEKAVGKDLITCVKLTPYQDANTNSLYVQANTIIPLPGVENYTIQIASEQEQGKSNRISSFAQNLNATYDRNRRDRITRFLSMAASIALNDLPTEVRPNKRSKWAGGWASGAPDHRYYRVWYDRPPWSNWGLSYRLNLYKIDEPESFSVNVELAHFTGELEDGIKGLRICDDQVIDKDRVLVTHASNELSDVFANTLANTLKLFIETITPVVDKFQDERTNQESVP